MPRQMRREFAGAIYHAMNRGDRREAVFRDEQDRRMFLASLTEASGAVQKGHDDEPEMDRPKPGNGQLDPRFQPARSQEKTGEFKK